MKDNSTSSKQSLMRIGQSVLLGSAILIGSGALAAGPTPYENLRKSPYPSYPKINYSKVANPKLVKHGEYLAKAGDCIACHTAEHSNRTFAGGLEFKTPFGSLYAPNITSDKKYGIGKWTEKQFAKAMRQGVAPDGSFFYAAFPYPYFNKLTDQDVKALYAYFKAIPAYHVQNKKNSMMFPLNWRFLQLGWRMLFFYRQKTGPYQADSKHSATWNRGKYLVDGLGHCGMCHTPSYYMLSKKFTLAAPIKKYYLAGAPVIGGYRAPNITSKLMKNVPVSEITNVFMKDQLVGGGKIAQPPMLEVNHNSLSHLSMQDLQSIATYLKTVKSKTPPMPSASGSDAGKGIYSTYCSACHTTGAGGAPKLGSKTAWAPLIKLGKNQLYSNAMNGIGGMPKKGNCNSCSAKQIQQAVDYMIGQAESGSASAAPATPRLKVLTLVDGKRIYKQYCAACHNPGSKYMNAPIIGNKAAWDKITKQGMDQVIAHVLNGYGYMAPKGACNKCTDEEVIVATKYMIDQSTSKGNYQLW